MILFYTLEKSNSTSVVASSFFFVDFEMYKGTITDLPAKLNGRAKLGVDETSVLCLSATDHPGKNMYFEPFFSCSFLTGSKNIKVFLVLAQLCI